MLNNELSVWTDLTCAYGVHLHGQWTFFELLESSTGFQWDDGNVDKNLDKHRVAAGECEQLFFNRPLVSGQDVKHSQDEPRFYALGRTDAGRLLFIAFTVRDDLIRVISARDMTRKER